MLDTVNSHDIFEGFLPDALATHRTLSLLSYHKRVLVVWMWIPLGIGQ